jgi:predicted AAA+ superfamily ATPase
MYITRHAVKTMERLRRSFPAVIITGARQVGKTTLLQNTLPEAEYRTFDDYILLEAAKSDAMGFVNGLRLPAVLDEIQYAPEILRPIKMRVDSEKNAGAFLLTGLQQFELMKGVNESLAGRAGLLSLPGLTTREIYGDAFDAPFLPTDAFLSARKPLALDTHELWRRIHRGSMPKLYDDKDLSVGDYYAAYVKTYVERDVRALTQVGDELAFVMFLTACAARTGNLLNLSDISRDVGISMPTAKRWLSILQTSGLVWLLQPYSRNVTVRTIKTPKLYFADTGLAAHLCKWLTPETLQSGAMRGAFFETYVIGEIIKSYLNAGQDAPVYYYRDVNGREMDLLLEQDGLLYPIEIKLTASPSAKDMKNFAPIKNALGEVCTDGAVICSYGSVLNLGAGKLVPVGMI